ncbi:MAG: exodeoxyribonuclease VII small subunit [Thermoleophilia bacterium]
MSTEPSFEAAEKELRQIVERLEGGAVPLEEAIALWERGEALYRLCRERLEQAEGKVEELARRVEPENPSA